MPRGVLTGQESNVEEGHAVEAACQKEENAGDDVDVCGQASLQAATVNTPHVGQHDSEYDVEMEGGQATASWAVVGLAASAEWNAPESLTYVSASMVLQS